jgi:hypothetical protein
VGSWLSSPPAWCPYLLLDVLTLARRSASWPAAAARQHQRVCIQLHTPWGSASPLLLCFMWTVVPCRQLTGCSTCLLMHICRPSSMALAHATVGQQHVADPPSYSAKPDAWLLSGGGGGGAVRGGEGGAHGGAGGAGAPAPHRRLPLQEAAQAAGARGAGRRQGWALVLCLGFRACVSAWQLLQGCMGLLHLYLPLAGCRGGSCGVCCSQQQAQEQRRRQQRQWQQAEAQQRQQESAQRPQRLPAQGPAARQRQQAGGRPHAACGFGGNRLSYEHHALHDRACSC